MKYIGRFIRSTLGLSGLIVIFLVYSSPCFAFILPDSGQVTCYDVAGAIMLCPEPETPMAQDGTYGNDPQSFTDNGDATITDNNTGLTWQKADDGVQYYWYQAAGVADPVYNVSNIDVCASAATGGFNDWRLPSKKELLSLSGYERTPSLDPLYFPSPKYMYWTSTPYAANTTQAWAVYADAGSPYSLDKNYIWGASVRCVRGQAPGFGDFVDNLDGTVTDRATNLVWQKGESGLQHWDAALAYCEGLSLGGYADWRLPSIREMESIVDDSRSMPSLNTAFFPGPYGYVYWTSTTYTSGSLFQYAWDITMLYGNYQGGKKDLNTQTAKCVRDAAITMYTLQVDQPSGGTVQSNDSVIVCPGACSGDYPEAAQVTLEAVALSGYIFQGWGGACSGQTSQQCVMSMTDNMSVSALFEADADGDGFVASQDCNDSNAAVYPGAAEIKFDGIDQDCNGYDLTIRIISAKYSVKNKTLTVEASSSLRGSAGLSLVGYKPMTWNSSRGRWTASVTGLASKPGSVTVAGKEGSVSAQTTTVR